VTLGIRMNQVRTCVGCRQTGNRANLVRIVKTQSNLSLDLTKTKPGRGCWIHPRNSCLTTAIDGKSISKALRVKVNEQVLLDLKEQAEKMLEI
jgi:predicted RNA-binding protein YlxR (DUF448 family)